MKEQDLLRHYPRLWHMAEDGSWDSIRKHGLLSTTSLLDLYGYAGKARLELEAARRPESVLIATDGLPHAIVRDQKPMTASALEKCLTDGTTPAEWFKTLNSRVFFWLSKEKLRGLLGARAYRETTDRIDAGHGELGRRQRGARQVEPDQQRRHHLPAGAPGARYFSPHFGLPFREKAENPDAAKCDCRTHRARRSVRHRGSRHCRAFHTQWKADRALAPEGNEFRRRSVNSASCERGVVDPSRPPCLSQQVGDVAGESDFTLDADSDVARELIEEAAQGFQSP
jgi:hypothetical protein